ncbi:MAG: DUF1559 domain-containing protein, partial [Planctomycetales bacterium]|nr:DUF1559 domain-containing protein [Planctomycetales bacterium]
VGLAVQNYLVAFNVLPPGGITEGPCCSTRSGTSWAISILPYVEQQALYDLYDMEAYNEDPVNQPVREAALKVYVCPTDLGTDELEVPGSGPATGAKIKYRRGSYRANTGRSTDNSWWGAQSSGETFDNFPLPGNWRGPMYTLGALNYTFVRPGDIRDGMSNTLLVGEMASSTTPNRRTYWAYSYAAYNKSYVTTQARTLLADYERCLAIGGPGGASPCKGGWGSFHPGGLQFVMCDGSVHFLPDTIDMILFADLGTIAGGEVVTLP